MDSIGEETLREILLNLPTRDVARCRCVCRLWGVVLTDQYFVNIHARATHVISGGGAMEALLISQTKPPQRMTVETTVYSVSSGKPMCRFTNLASSYVPANICNGFILYASSVGSLPLFVGNPLTGDKIKIPPPPPVEVERTVGQYLFAMGFSASTGQYKLFLLPFGEPKTKDNNYLDVHTLCCGGGSWRRHPELFPCHGVMSPPVLVGDKLYVLMKPSVYARRPDMILVIDVASEEYHAYRLMPGYNKVSFATMNVLELGGQPYVAVHVLQRPEAQLHIWAMPTPKLLLQQEGQQKLHEKLPGEWELRYSFHGDIPDSYSFNSELRGVWVEDDAMLCCIICDRLYQIDTVSIHKEETKHKVGSLAWNHQLRLPSPPRDYFRRRSIYGGYRPTLLSPRDLIAQISLRSSMTRPPRNLITHGCVLCDTKDLENASVQHARSMTAVTSMLPRGFIPNSIFLMLYMGC
jgi:hypothetical protein